MMTGSSYPGQPSPKSSITIGHVQALLFFAHEDPRAVSITPDGGGCFYRVGVMNEADGLHLMATSSYHVQESATQAKAKEMASNSRPLSWSLSEIQHVFSLL
jgi:hypothetical protein